MFRVGACRSAVRMALRSNLRLCTEEFHHLVTRKCPGNSVLSAYDFQFPKNIKLRQIIWREYRAVCSMLLRSGFTKSNSAFMRILSTNSRRGFHMSAPFRQNENPKKKDELDSMQFVLKAFAVLVLLVVILGLFLPDDRIHAQVSWQEFVHQMLAKGEVQQVVVMADDGIAHIILHENAILNGKPVRNRVFQMRMPDVNRFEEKLREAEQQLGVSQGNAVPVVFERQKDSIGPYLAAALFAGLILFSIFADLKKVKGLEMPWSSFTKAKYTLVDPRLKDGRGVKFADIAGLKEAKQEVMEFVDYLKKPELYRRLGAKVPKGSLLLGPPGCGKTLLAKAVATEANVPFLSMNGSEFIEVVGGLGASRVRDLFQDARQKAPCIVYIDEIDAIGGKRHASDFGTNEKIQTLLQLLTEMDGMANNDGVVMLASTNRAEVLDEALLRPGRFDRHILIGQPTIIERKEIFEVYLNKLQLDNPSTHYSGRLAQLTPSYSGADIANICNEAALHAAGLEQKKITAADLEFAVSRVKFGREKKERTIRVDERKQIAYYQAGRTIVGWMLKHTDALMQVSIVQYTSGVGSMQHFRPASFLTFKEELYDRMTMYLGGKAAELLVFHQSSTHADNDLKKVSKVAYSMITDYGMNDTVGEVSFPPAEENRRRFYSRKLHGIIDFEARKLVAECFSSAEQIVKTNADKVVKLAEELLKKETLTYEEVCALIGPPPHGHKNLVDMIEFGPESPAQSAGAESRSAPPPPRDDSEADTPEK